MKAIHDISIKRALLGGLAALSIVAGSGIALIPQSAHAAETSRVLYREYFEAGSLNGELARGACTNQYVAPRYGVHRTEARVTWNVFNINGQSYNQLDCIGYTTLPAETFRPARYYR